MLKSFVVGLGLLALIALASLVMGDWGLIRQLTGIVGFGLLLLSAIFSGALLSGDRIRANYAFEDKEERRTRFRWSVHMLLAALPSIVVFMLTLKFAN
ncbi:DUF5316 domain-containing protein [Brevibacillus sp. B_LB10_24]|uniref:DUF5316 domain-containing protein n=1 Tax=Brevibacillus sp. B_LB10_24 TaxID=3380645 RepID=UPI0038B8587A